MPSDLIEVFTLCVGSLTLLMLGLAFHTGTVRGFIEKRYHLPEDEKMSKGKNTLGEDGPKTKRYTAAHRNLLENFVPFFAVGSLFAAKVETSEFWAVAMIAFVAFRVLHTIAYINALQPFRTLSFFGGWLVVFGMSGYLVFLSV